LCADSVTDTIASLMLGKMLISDSKARLKPCLRCGYSLCHIHHARNCPECGLAVRVSLGVNRGLDWSNPVWLKWLTVATGVLAVAHLLMPIHWIVEYIFDWYEGDESAILYRVGCWVWHLLWPAMLLIGGMGMCFLARNERRHPDTIWFVRWILTAIGCCQMAMAILAGYFMWRVRIASLTTIPPYWIYWICSLVHGFWVVWVTDLAMLIYVGAFGIRGRWRRYNQYFSVVIGISSFCFFAHFAEQRFDVPWFLLLCEILWKWVYGLSLAVLLFWTSWNFWQCRRAALTNWVSD
jgi:hypothetical protein